MHSLKKSFTAFLGLAALVGLIVSTTPSRTQGQGGVSGKDVNVVNTPFVNVANRVGLAIGTRVGIDPDNNTVKVDATTPLQVRDADDARQPFRASAPLFMPDGDGGAEFLANLPEGKRLVVEYVSLEMTLPPGQRAMASLDSVDFVAASSREHWLILTPQGPFPGTEGYEEKYVASQVVKIYVAQPDDGIRLKAFRNASTGEASGRVTIEGYLVDLP